MTILFVFVGLFVGFSLNWASDFLPHLARRVKTKNGREWWWLHLGTMLLSALFFAYLWRQFGFSRQTLFLAAGYAFFLLVAIIDLKYRLVLNWLIYPAAVAVLFTQMMLGQQAAVSILLGGIMALAIFALTAWLRPGDLGGGDIKLATLIGLTLGFPQVLWALLVGAGLGGVTAVVLLWLHRQPGRRTIPYAPFLCLGAMTALFYNPFPVFP